MEEKNDIQNLIRTENRDGRKKEKKKRFMSKLNRKTSVCFCLVSIIFFQEFNYISSWLYHRLFDVLFYPFYSHFKKKRKKNAFMRLMVGAHIAYVCVCVCVCGYMFLKCNMHGTVCTMSMSILLFLVYFLSILFWV